VLLTGHTGFKGSWLALWLAELDARVHGFALEPPTTPSLFEIAKVRSVLESDTRADLADLAALEECVRSAEPEVVFHLAAQPLVRDGYVDPLGTLRTNVLGTAHVLEAVRPVDSVQAVVIVTTDKVYQDETGLRPCQETDPLGGSDPYSASKAAAEIVTSSYRASFFEGGYQSRPARVATARAGNVIGGADWAKDRLLPDCLRAFSEGRPIRLRNPGSIRPWQHVVEPLSGYLRLAECLLGERGNDYACAWNFGPDPGDDATVLQVARAAAAIWGPGAAVEEVASPDGGGHEVHALRLDNTRAREDLGWRPRWALPQALEMTVAWHRAWMGGEDMAAFTRQQIGAYIAAPV
jgi:CDP-glucose 4,6-dehydratase